MEKAKVTKKIVLTAIAAVAAGMSDLEVDGVTVTEQDIIDYVDKTIAQMDNKNAKARERAAKAKAEGDEITKAIEAVLTEEPQTIAEILAAVDVENLTPAKVVARVSTLVKDGKVEKSEVKNAAGSKVKAYALIAE